MFCIFSHYKCVFTSIPNPTVLCNTYSHVNVTTRYTWSLFKIFLLGYIVKLAHLSRYIHSFCTACCKRHCKDPLWCCWSHNNPVYCKNDTGVYPSGMNIQTQFEPVIEEWLHTPNFCNLLTVTIGTQSDTHTAFFSPTATSICLPFCGADLMRDAIRLGGDKHTSLISECAQTFGCAISLMVWGQAVLESTVTFIRGT